MTQEPGTPPTRVTPLALERHGTGARPIVVARGEIDVATSPMLRSELASVLASQPEDITVDFRDVAFVDSSGLGVLVGALKRLREGGGGTVAVVGAQDAVRKVFEITGLDSLFELGDQ